MARDMREIVSIKLTVEEWREIFDAISSYEYFDADDANTLTGLQDLINAATGEDTDGTGDN